MTTRMLKKKLKSLYLNSKYLKFKIVKIEKYDRLIMSYDGNIFLIINIDVPINCKLHLQTHCILKYFTEMQETNPNWEEDLEEVLTEYFATPLNERKTETRKLVH